MEPNEWSGLLGIARKAGRLVIGQDPVLRTLQAGKARLALLTEDASLRTSKQIGDKASFRNVPLERLPISSEAFGSLLGKAPVACAAVTDRGLAEALRKRLRNEDTDRQ